MPTIGLTGGFGTGKSYVASIFKKLGAKVVDADRIAHNIIRKGSAAHKKIVASFGRSILDAKGRINRRELGRIVFSDKKRLARLNRIVHPGVIKEIRERIKGSRDEILIIDAPLICETNLSGLMNFLVVVKASKKKQVERCVKKFNMEKKDVCKRMACQIPLEEKVRKADYVIDNDGTRKETAIQVKRLWQELKRGKRLWR